MTFYIDADSFPALARDFAIDLAGKHRIPVVCVANRPLKLAGVQTIEVTKEKDAADNYILDAFTKGDLVLTQDLLLAQKFLKQQGHAINGYGLLFTQNNIDSLLIERKIALAIATADRSYRSSAKNYQASHVQEFAKTLNMVVDQFLRGRL